jgi:hypothetical protein
MTAMTTSNSIKVKAPDPGCWASGSVHPGTFMFIWTADMANAHAVCRVAQLYAACGFWNPANSIASTIMLWACLWLQYFELWLVTDEWHGRGEHPDSKESVRAKGSGSI